MPEFYTGTQSGLKNWQGLLTANQFTDGSQPTSSFDFVKMMNQNSLLKSAVMGNAPIIITPCKPPPSQASVEEFLKKSKLMRKTSEKPKEIQNQKISDSGGTHQAANADVNPKFTNLEMKDSSTPIHEKKKVGFTDRLRNADNKDTPGTSMRILPEIAEELTPTYTPGKRSRVHSDESVVRSDILETPHGKSFGHKSFGSKLSLPRKRRSVSFELTPPPQHSTPVNQSKQRIYSHASLLHCTPISQSKSQWQGLTTPTSTPSQPDGGYSPKCTPIGSGQDSNDEGNTSPVIPNLMRTTPKDPKPGTSKDGNQSVEWPSQSSSRRSLLQSQMKVGH